jgi:hypothetical protein
MARAHRHLWLRLVFITAVAVALAGMILVIVISFQSGPAAQAYALSGNNRWKALAGAGVFFAVLGAITALITGLIRWRVVGGDAGEVTWAGLRACLVTAVCCGILVSIASSAVKDKAATLPVPATITSCTQDPNSLIVRCSYRWEVAEHAYSGTADADSYGSAGQHVVIDVVPADPGNFNSTPGGDESFLTTDLLFGFAAGPLIIIAAVGWIYIEIVDYRDDNAPGNRKGRGRIQ